MNRKRNCRAGAPPAEDNKATDAVALQLLQL
jgi:hypothetical protein